MLASALLGLGGCAPGTDARSGAEEGSPDVPGRAATATPAEPSQAPSAPEVVQRAGGYLTTAGSAEIEITNVRSGNVHRIVGDLAGTRTRRVVTHRSGGVLQRITLGDRSYVNGDVPFWRGRGQSPPVARRLSGEYLEISPDGNADDMSVKGQVEWAFGDGPVAQRLRAGTVRRASRGGSLRVVRLTATGDRGAHTLDVAADGTFRPVALTTDQGDDTEERWRFLRVDVPVDTIVAPPPESVYRPKVKG